ncbi:hypothetical protein T492DRAFT_1002766 [Pavlovales sp. CCMP2436]|nr:hypothetical protein T492DRAFT_1002766 [Pavlovales sp. CCMP2436]|mmetsp:Transcript_7558/g.18508  ORF Transcript_7558/g.18508 Transcript_7558/m.18508 type:complete len:191 (+) Transcript_7558:250-822(+)
MAGDQFIAGVADQCREGEVCSAVCCGPLGQVTNTCFYDPAYPGDKELPCCAVDTAFCCCLYASARCDGSCGFPVGCRRAEAFLCQLGCPCCVLGVLDCPNFAQVCSGTSHLCGFLRSSCLVGTSGIGDGMYSGYTFLADGSAPLMDVSTCACCFLQCYPAVTFFSPAPHKPRSHHTLVKPVGIDMARSPK